jgi:hypothetical protein
VQHGYQAPSSPLAAGPPACRDLAAMARTSGDQDGRHYRHPR